MSNRFRELLAQREYLIADGAIGTNLFAMGLQTGDAPELWNLENPGKIAALHQSFVDAGSDLFLTNSFGGTRYRLMLHQAQDRVREINLAAARIAREVADGAGRPVIVAGSMGPTGEILQPVGELSTEHAVAAFAEQAAALAEGGVDVLWIETMSSREEVECAVEGASGTGLPVVCTLSFDTNGHTMMGITPAEAVNLCADHGTRPVAVGANCGTGASELVTTVLSMSAANPESILVAKANCGIPEYVDGSIVYNGTPALMADYACLAVDAGARIVGGCCGTTPAHVRAMKHALKDHTRGARPDLETVVARLGAVSMGGRAQYHGEPSPAAGTSARRGRRGRRRPGVQD